MAARSSSLLRPYHLFLYRQGAFRSQPESERISKHLNFISGYHSSSAGLRLNSQTSYCCSRPLHTASLSLKDAALDEENPFYDKYGEKLDKIKGMRRSKIQAKIMAARLQEKSRDKAFVPPVRPSAHSHYTLIKPPSLDSVMHVEKITDLSSEDISALWREYHKDKDAICATIPADGYKELLAKAIHCPYFVYPLPRDEGYEFMFGQFSGHRCHFTSLINYQQYQENAPVALTLTHYTELQDSKGIVLMAGEVDTVHLTSFEAQYLANQVQLYYNSQDAHRYALLHTFNYEPENFDYRQLLDQLTTSSISNTSSDVTSEMKEN